MRNADAAKAIHAQLRVKSTVLTRMRSKAHARVAQLLNGSINVSNG